TTPSSSGWWPSSAPSTAWTSRATSRRCSASGAGEKAKIELTSATETTINLPFIAQKSGQPVHLEKKVTRAKLEQLTEPVLNRLDGPIRQAFKDGGWQYRDVNHVILVGGPTRMPAVQSRFE